MSENTVMDITQDNEGLIWIATWNGLNRFDGVNFKVYKTRQSDSEEWGSNRIEQLEIDLYGNVWCITYDNRAFIFEQRSELFREMPQPADGKPIIPVKSITTLPNGTVWLLSDTNGAMRVVHDKETGKTTSAVYLSAEAGCSRSAQVNSVFLDNHGYEWVITSSGLLRIGSDGEESEYFVNSTPYPEADCRLFTASELGGRIFFGGTNGMVWVFSYDTDKFQLFKIDSQGDIIALKMIDGTKLAAITNIGDIFVRNTQTGEKKVYKFNDKFDFNKHPAASIYVDSHNEIWFGVEKHGAVCHFNLETQVFKTEQMKVEIEPAERSAPYFSACEDIHGNLWIHPMGGGLAWFDRKQNKLVPFHNEFDSSDWRFSEKLHSMMTDRQGNLWLGTHSKGLEKVTFYESDFSFFIPSTVSMATARVAPTLEFEGKGGNKYAATTDANHVRTVFEDNKHRIWLGTRDGRVSVYDKDWQLIGYLTTDGRISKVGTLFIGVIYKIMQDSKGSLWIATKGQGLMRLEENGNKYTTERITHDSSNPYSLSSNVVYDIAEDGKGRIWAVTFDKGINMIEAAENGGRKILNSNNDLKTYPLERCGKARRMIRDDKGILWVATSNGLLSFDENFNDAESIDFNLHIQTADEKNSVGGNNIYDILKTSKGELYFASFDGGLSKFEGLDGSGKAEFRSFTMEDGLPTDVLYSLAEDNQGNVWIGTEYGLSCMNTETKKFDNFIHELRVDERSLQGQSDVVDLEESTALRCSDGRMMFGTNSGVLTFYPEEIEPNDYVPDIVFTELRINGEAIAPSTHSVLPVSLNSIDELILSHKENMVSISFAALDFTFPSSIRYAYKLEGFDQGWNYIGKQQSATYTNLPHGEYTFMVASTNGAGVWIPNIRTMKVKVKPSFNETPFAICLYAVLCIAVLALIAYIFFTIFKLKHEVSVEQRITALKLSFFTDISHELRTPLTLIAGPIEHILNHAEIDDEVRNQLDVVQRNTDRMLHLVNQILDFRKIQNSKMKLHVEQIEVVGFLRKIMGNFESIAKECGTDFVFESELPEATLWADADKLEKIVFNLLSNAFKYTPRGKSIRLFLREEADSISIGVEDKGIGIPKDKQASIFVKFETLLDTRTFISNSTGIGLALVKELVELHHAEINLVSEEGKGSCFTVVFKKGKEHYNKDVDFIIDDYVSAEEIQEEAAIDKDREMALKTMLIVEDNTELRTFLRTVFAPTYNIIEAADGEEGLDKARQIVPDIIITDVSMPRKDGIELTKDLRSDMTTSHIPIILLTAKTDTDTKLRGIELGAESYITKPFSASYLEARVNNLLARRESLQHFYYERLIGSLPDSQKDEEQADKSVETADMAETVSTVEIEKSLSEQDQKFVEQLTRFMEQNIDNGELVVDDLAKELAVSRSVLFKKMKSLTGLAPIEFIREMRVTRAAKLIETGKYTMTQISAMVGINDARYFSRCFKQRYGMTPTEYKTRDDN